MTRILALSLTVVALPFLLAVASHRTFAPVDALYTTALPYAETGLSVIPDNHFWSDTVNFYLPRLFTLARHEVPISFVTGGGLPLYADTISGFFDPFSILFFYVIPPGDFSLELFWLCHYLLLTAGLYLWLRRQGVSDWGCFAAAVTQAYCTAFFPGSYMSFQTLGALTFLPWALWALESPSVRTRAWLPGAFLALSFCCANIQTAMYPLAVYVLWALITRRLAEGIRNGVLAVLLSFPFWSTGFIHHVLQAENSAGSRLSEVPPTEWGKLKALLALPGVLVPDLLGSSKSVDLLKALQTSCTYFIGSIGIAGPLLALSSFRKASWSNPLNRLAVFLLGFVLIVVTTPLLNVLYYRILCLACLALSILTATHLDQTYDRPRRQGLFLGAAAAIVALAVAAPFVKAHWRAPLTALLFSKLSSGTYGWWPALSEARMDRWFRTYLATPHFLLLPLVLLLCWLARRKRAPVALALLVAFECILIWSGQVTLNQVRPVSDAGFERLDQILRRSPSYPASRFLNVHCGAGPYLFHFVTNEYQNVPRVNYYGSTPVGSVPTSDFLCRDTDHTVVLTEPEKLRLSVSNVVIARAGWTLSDPAYFAASSSGAYTFWLRKDLLPAVATADSAKQTAIETRVLDHDHYGIQFRIAVKSPVDRWILSIPSYPGWTYELDGSPVVPSAKIRNLPLFDVPLTAASHELRARFFPVNFWWSIAAVFAGILWMLYATCLAPFRQRGL